MEREVRDFHFRLSGLAPCGFDFVNPFDLKTSALVMILNSVFAWRIENTVNSVLLLVVEYVVVGHAEFVLWSGLELFQLFSGQRSHWMTVDEFWHRQTNFHRNIRVELLSRDHPKLTSLQKPINSCGE